MAKTFREGEYRQDAAIETMRAGMSEEAFCAEGLGLWRLTMKGWFTQAMVDGAREIGIAREVVPIIGAGQCGLSQGGRETHFFLGVDPAPAQGEKSDDGTLAVLRAARMEGRSGEYSQDWQKDVVYARRVRGATMDEWTGIIHEKHMDFGFDGICIDLGGGGQFVGPQLQRSRQLIRGRWQTVKPILPRDTHEIEGSPLYFLFSRGEKTLKDPETGLWGEELRHARGDDVLKELGNTLFQSAMQRGELGLPAEFNSLKPAEISEWCKEREWASKCLTALGSQLVSYKVLTNPDGTWKLTAHNAKQFVSDQKDDLHDSVRNALVAFEAWLLTFVEGCEQSDEDAVGCSS